MYGHAARRAQGDRLAFSLVVQDWQSKRRKTITLHAVCGPGDSAEPVVTLMLPGQD